MAFSLCCRASSSWPIVSATALRRRLPLVGAFCMLSFGLSNLCLSYSSSLKTGRAQSLPFAPLLRYPPPTISAIYMLWVLLISFKFDTHLCVLAFDGYVGYWGFCLRSKFGGQSPAKNVHTIRMEGSSNTVPSIVVYVTVPNKELGLWFSILFYFSSQFCL
jgi:periplasmic divalent cation tolerance protein